MPRTSFRSLLAGTAMAATACVAIAQTTAPISPTPAAVGTTPQTAAEANRKAVQRSDTSTLVRTGPSAADRARSAMNDGTRSTDGSAASNQATGLAPKPDRN